MPILFVCRTREQRREDRALRKSLAHSRKAAPAKADTPAQSAGHGFYGVDGGHPPGGKPDGRCS